MRHILVMAAIAIGACAAAVAPPPSSVDIPWGEIYTALQETNLGPEDMKDLQQFMQDRITQQQQQRQQQKDLEDPSLVAIGGVHLPTDSLNDVTGSPSPFSLSSSMDTIDAATESSPSPSPSTTPEFDWKATLTTFKEQTKVIERSVQLRKAGNALLAQGDMEGARESYREALEVLRRESVISTSRTRRCEDSCRLNMAVCESKKGDMRAACEMYTTILEKGEAEGEIVEAVKIQCLTKRAKCSQKLGDVEAAMADLVEANFIRPRDQAIAEELKAFGGIPVEPPTPPSLLPTSPFGGLDSMFGGLPTAGGQPGAAGADLLGGLLSGLGEGGAAGGSPLEALAGKWISSMGSKILDIIDQPATQIMICNLAQKLEPDYIKGLAATAGIPINDGTVGFIHKKATSLKPADLERWVKRGKTCYITYKTSKRTWKAVKPLVRPTRLLLTYTIVLRWMVACVWA